MKYKYTIKGLECANCAKKVENRLNQDKEIEKAIVNFSTSKVIVETKIKNPLPYLNKIIEEVEPDAKLVENKEESNNQNRAVRIIAGGIIGAIGILLKLPLPINTILIVIGAILLLLNTVTVAFKTILKKNINENFLVTISCIGAFVLGQPKEGLMVAFLYELGKYLEAKAVSKSRNSIADLMDIAEKTANVKVGKTIKKMPVEKVKIGSIIVVKEGEKVPLDGTVISGNAALDTSALTGESILLEVKEKDNVLSGSINRHGLIEIEVTSTYEDSAVSKILELVESATERKSKTETIVSKYASKYTIGVLITAIVVATTFPILSNITYSESIYKGLTILVISCPCAIAISVPLSYFSGIGRASKEGILIKGSNYLDSLRKINQIIFDKTGTITTGNFIISKINIHDKKYTKEEVLDLYAKGESFSNHPIAQSIMKKYSKEVDTSSITKYKEVPGQGLSYTYNNQKIKIGSSHFCQSKNTDNNIYLSIDDKIVASLELQDEIKENCQKVVSELNKMNIKVHMFTGDNKIKANQIAKAVGIQNIKYQMLPEDKYNSLEQIIKIQNTSGLVSFVGDGINDAPVIALSDIGISMGSIGTDSAIEASDVVIMNDNLEKIITAIKISLKTNKIIKENLIFAIAVKTSVLILSLIGISTMWEAVFADVGVTIICILNTLRLIK